MRLTIIGGSGGIPGHGTPCSGYLITEAGFGLLVDPGYGIATALSADGAPSFDAVLVSHAHPDHCADLNPLLRAVAWSIEPRRPIDVFAPPGAVDAVLALDRPAVIEGSYRLHTFEIGATLKIGPLQLKSTLLPHPRPNAGFRLSAGGVSLAYTGDCGPSPELVRLARGADLLLAEASYAPEVPTELLGALSSARDAARQAAQARVRHLVLTHLMPATDPAEALAVARSEYDGPIDVARPNLSFDITPGGASTS